MNVLDRNIDQKGFRDEMIKSLNSGVMSEKCGAYVLQLINIHLNSKFFSGYNDSVKDIAHGYILDIIMARFTSGSRPDDDKKMFSYYRSIVINGLRKFIARNINGSERSVDLYGQSIATDDTSGSKNKRTMRSKIFNYDFILDDIYEETWFIAILVTTWGSVYDVWHDIF